MFWTDILNPFAPLASGVGSTGYCSISGDVQLTTYFPKSAGPKDMSGKALFGPANFEKT